MCLDEIRWSIEIALHLLGVDKPAEKIPPDDQRGEERGENAEGQRNRETFDRPARFPKKNRRCDQGCDVGVENGGERFFVGGLQRDLERFAERELFPQSLVNQHARIHRQTDRQDDARNTRKSEDEVEHRERAHQQDDVHDQHEIRDQAGEFVVDHHEHECDREAEKTGENTAPNRIESECRRDTAFFFHAHRRLERVLQHAGQTARFLFLETACDDGIAPVNRSPDAGRGLNHAVEHDGETMADIRLGDLPEFLCAFAVELQLHRPAFIAVVGV